MTGAEWADLEPSDFELNVEAPAVVLDLKMDSLSVKNALELNLKLAVCAVSAVASDLNVLKLLAQLGEYFARVDDFENEL